MLERILIAGSGGQGSIFLGKMMARLATPLIPHVTFFPAYGAEVRGGTSYCHVVFSSEEIGSPVAEAFDSMLIMDQQSANRFLAQLNPQGLGIVNRTLCDVPKKAGHVWVAATEIADTLGHPKAANLVMLGAYLAHKHVIPPLSVEEEIARSTAGMSPSAIEANLKAFRQGLAC
ncbi:MAG: 2-oxoacid:acceptor oxidoreductase family protein [Lentisphaerae bacterium]|nr:2-oxoacid:acceptor oxidoreductase family protein [Lentisphaerota bacterium]